MTSTPAEIKEENRRLAYLRFLVDQALQLIRSGEVSREQAVKMVTNIRRQALILFPGKEAVFELVYQPRFQRAITETFRLH
ncbi:MAG: hypothetical protein BZ151_07255 [Desulfobacca sp. 4484_104]|nr:MAG: hypothetical protein BZ151_07255 [Desulfobacca sp. 4484_104]RLA87652.1 MAG: hypothetical protein DRG58_10160 [Deltaproteobacteria bacterium]